MTDRIKGFWDELLDDCVPVLSVEWDENGTHVDLVGGEP